MVLPSCGSGVVSLEVVVSLAGGLYATCYCQLVEQEVVILQ